jgi:hypothetical protein
MSAYVKGFLFCLFLVILLIPSYGLVIGAVVIVSAVKILVAFLSFLVVPVAGIVHFFVKGSLFKKVLFILGILVMVGILAYILITINFIVKDKPIFQNFMDQKIGTSKIEDVRGIGIAPMPVDTGLILYESPSPTEAFINTFVFFSVSLSVTTFLLASVITILIKKIMKKEIQIIKLLLKVLFLSMFFSAIIGLIFAIKRVSNF